MIRPPIIIVGAARSGTNLLRDILTGLPGFRTWPCDEIPYVWRHGNRDWPDDEFGRELGRPAVRAYIRRRFVDLAAGQDVAVVEKTCANSLRVGFVDEVLPEARFVIIVRHGLDAAASAMKRWRAGFDLGYSLAKLRYVPPGDLPHYAVRYLQNRLRRAVSREKRLSVWGPVFAGMRDLPPDIPLTELAIRQWARCVERTEDALADLPAARQHRVRYEDLVTDPAATMAGILAFLDATPDPAILEAAVATVRTDSIGKARRSLAPDDRAAMARLAGPALRRLDYPLEVAGS